MKFKDWNLDDLISTLKLIRTSPDFRYENVIRVSGEIHVFNGERKDGQPEDEIWG
jgi:hypothetical protein